jgi:hypothetical protein
LASRSGIIAHIGVEIVPSALLLPDGRSLTGGVRAVIRDLLNFPGLALARPERLGASAIRARLRRVPGWPGALTPEGVEWAFGFRPDARPAGS